jgi:cytoskeletal protein CcmA (bactofilin family)
MFKKTEESEWTRFSRALGGTQPAPTQDEELARTDEAEEPATLVQATPPPTEPEVYMAAPPPPPAPAEREAPLPTYTPPPAPAPVTAPTIQMPASRGLGADSGETVIGEGATIDGTVRSERSIRVIGAIQGEIESQQRVVVDEQARVQARITAAQVTVLGEVNGSINCTGRVEIASTARVTGEVSAGTLVIQEGAFFEGSLKMATSRDDA